jgi:manganese oxidase
MNQVSVQGRPSRLRAAVTAAVLAGLVLAGCAKPTQEPPAPASSGPTWQEIDAHHKHGVEAFPAATQGKGNQPLQPEIDGAVKVFRLTVGRTEWEVSPGKRVPSFVINGQTPGPLIRVTEGDRVRVVVTNQLSESTALHWHGLRLENEADGVPFITQDPIRPGESYTYEFTARNAGSHMYHSHHNAAVQATGGLLGALIIDPKEEAQRNRYGEHQDVLMILGDGARGYTINGKGFPATEPIVARVGEKIRIRLMNEGFVPHPMHVHGLAMLVVERDGYPLSHPYMVDTLNVAPGERYDVIIEADAPGVWAFHCHVLTHAESAHGMHGMVTAIIVGQ